MAPQPGAERLLAKRLFQKTPSARLCLALGLGLLLLAGCGGGDEGGSSTGAGASSDPSTTASSQGAAQKQSSSARTQGPSAADEAKGQPQGSSAASDQASSGGAGGKHGAHIASPKGPRETAPTPAQTANATVADMALESPAISPTAGSVGVLPATYTCDGKDSWPALSWQGVPAGTAELALFAMSLQPVEEKLFVDWAVAGLDPSLTGIEAERLPKGAVVGRNSFGKIGYEICPPAPGETYMFAVYALPRALSPPKGFDSRELRKEVLDVSGNVGLLPAAYAR